MPSSDGCSPPACSHALSLEPRCHCCSEYSQPAPYRGPLSLSLLFKAWGDRWDVMPLQCYLRGFQESELQSCLCGKHFPLSHPPPGLHFLKVKEAVVISLCVLSLLYTQMYVMVSASDWQDKVERQMLQSCWPFIASSSRLWQVDDVYCNPQENGEKMNVVWTLIEGKTR